MTKPLCLLDSDTLSELARRNPKVERAARAYLTEHGRLSFSAVTVFERLRGYRAAIARGRPYEEQLREFERLCFASLVVAIDAAVAARAAVYWAALPVRARSAYADILIAATAATHGMTLVTHNQRDFEPIAKLDDALSLLDWAR